jgi:ATP-binding cassette, subfamily B, bacterial
MLVLGLYQPTGGTINIDGHGMATSAAKAVRAQTGTVLQEPYIFSGTIAENISFHDNAVSEQDIAQAATTAGLHEEIMAMPQGYATRLAERGTGLSGGQRQRLAIARALLRHPRLLVLDEATSHLDTVVEARVHQNLSRSDCTQLVIAHRLSTIRDADQILVLHQGKLAEQGNHRVLLAAGGHYAALVAAQLNGHSDTTIGARNGTVVAALPNL